MWNKTNNETYFIVCLQDLVSYSIVSSPLAQQYFYIAEDVATGQGIIYIKRSLAENKLNDTYTVSMGLFSLVICL